ncbi:MAG: hypothetical protein V1907_00560 [Candidatus Kerfeldbacteria bacterium]
MNGIEVHEFPPDDSVGAYVPMTPDEVAQCFAELNAYCLARVSTPRRHRGAGRPPVTLMLGPEDLEDGFRFRKIPGEKCSSQESANGCVSGECPRCGSCLNKAGICSICEGDYTDGFGQGFVAAAVTAEFGKTTSGGDVFVFSMDHPRLR